MSPPSTQVSALRSALLVSPDNVPLRIHLADTLVSLERFSEAELEYREALRVAPGDDSAVLGLAESLLAQGRLSDALALAEELDERGTMLGRPQIQLARIHLLGGRIDEAREAYSRGVEADISLANPHLEQRLGLTAPPPPAITFSQVGGMEAVKEEIRVKAIYPIAQPELFESYGKRVGGGVLMYGPPGCGKTYLARATAGEIEGAFISVGLNDVLNLWTGSGVQNLHQIFQRARSQRPSVLFFDEVDALGATRSAATSGQRVVNQFLAEFDGATTSNEGVLILGATNAPWNVDSAFRRPARFDQVIFVPPPDSLAREAIFAVHLEARPTADIDLSRLAGKTDGFSGADIMGVVDRTVEACLRVAVKTGHQAPVSQSDLLDEIKRTRPSVDEWFIGARNYVKFANDGGLYDDLASYVTGR
jgi:transitional endoplasmic reticulum ATPase